MLMSKNNMVSIIVPIYNTEKYLNSCITALVNQTYKNLEILLIVDGATDRSADICRKWQEKDSRIVVYENENHGVSFSRNFGFERCNGRYVTCVDSDDLIHEQYVETLIDIKQKSNADFAVVKTVAFDELNEPCYEMSDSVTVYQEELQEKIFTITNGTSGGKLFDAQILKAANIRFNQDIYVCEDLLLNIRYAEHCSSIAFSDSVLYGYRQRPGSAVHNTASSRWFSCLQAYKILFEDYRQTSAFPYIVFYGLKNLYEAKYLIRHKKAKEEWSPVDIEQQVCFFEKHKGLLPATWRLKLWICKYSFFVVYLRRK